MLDYDLLNKNVYLVPLVAPSVALVFGFYSSTNSRSLMAYWGKGVENNEPSW